MQIEGLVVTDACAGALTMPLQLPLASPSDFASFQGFDTMRPIYEVFSMDCEFDLGDLQWVL